MDKSNVGIKSARIDFDWLLFYENQNDMKTTEFQAFYLFLGKFPWK